MQAVILEAGVDAFQTLFDSVSKEYKLIGKNIQPEKKDVAFQASNCVMLLHAPHMGSEMRITYITENWYMILENNQRSSSN